jgi:hypothetical protein
MQAKIEIHFKSGLTVLGCVEAMGTENYNLVLKPQDGASVMVHYNDGRTVTFRGEEVEAIIRQELIEVEQPCKVCNNVRSIYRYKVAAELMDGTLGGMVRDRPARFCPDCGRPLTREASANWPPLATQQEAPHDNTH